MCKFNINTYLAFLFNRFEFIVLLLLIFTFSTNATVKEKPNIVFILADDLGYADLGCYGSQKILTPNLDNMATEGIRFTQFYAPAGVCTPTRASLLTGCYPKRVGLHVGVLSPGTKSGLNPNEITIAELLKEEGYVSG
jgi:arylsulfatase A